MVVSPTKDPTERLLDFFNFMWGDTEGFVYIPTLVRSTEEWRKTYFAWPSAKSGLIQYILSQVAVGKEVYFSPALYKDATKQPRKDNILGSRVLWAEYDGTALEACRRWEPTDAILESAPIDAARASQPAMALSDGQPPGNQGHSLPIPSLRVQSSTEDHQHMYWKLKEFSTDVSFIETANRGIAYTTGADVSGWDITQILRPIHTINQKRGLEVQLCADNEAVYSLEIFNQFKPIKELVSLTVDEADLPDVTTTLAKYTWPADDIALIMKSGSEVPDGMRARSLMRIGYLCAELGLTDNESYALLIFLDDKWGKYKGRSDRKRRLLDIINKAKTRYPHAVESPTFDGLRSESLPERNPQVVYGFNELLKSKVQIDWIIKDLMPKSGLGLVVSDPGIGKTQLLLNLGIACALGHPWLNWNIETRHRVLFLELEMSAGPVKHVIANMAQERTAQELDELDQRFKLAPMGYAMPMKLDAGKKYLENLIKEYQPEGLYIDSLQKLGFGLSKDEEVQDFMAWLSRMRQLYSMYTLLIHHHRKDADTKKKSVKDLDDVYGSRFITAEADLVMSLHNLPQPKVIEVSVLKNRLAEIPKPVVARRTPNLTFNVLGKEEVVSLDGLYNGSGSLSKGSNPIERGIEF